MVRRALSCLLLVLVAVPATSANAAVTTKKAIWGPVEIDSQSQFPVYKELGAGIYQTTLNWAEVASLEPLDAKDVEDPSYEWPDEIDTAIAEAKQRRHPVALTVTGAPEWANGDKPSLRSDQGRRLRHVRRASPPSATRASTCGASGTARTRAAPAKYAQLLDGAYASLKTASQAQQGHRRQLDRTPAPRAGSPSSSCPTARRRGWTSTATTPSGSKAPTKASLDVAREARREARQGPQALPQPGHARRSARPSRRPGSRPR